MTDLTDTHENQDLAVFVHALRRSGWIERNAFVGQECVGRTDEFWTPHTLRDMNLSSFLCVWSCVVVQV